jgi:hypothetical protein
MTQFVMNRMQISVKELPAGVYICNFYAPRGNIATQKITITH